MKLTILTLITIQLCVFSQLGYSEDNYLNEIVVADKMPIISKVSNTFIVDRKNIEKRGDISLEDSLETVPNLNVRSGGQGVPRIDIRGLRARHVKLLLNGIPFNSTYDGQFDPTFIPTSQVDRIKVTTGSTSELYGAGAFGVIDIRTRTSHEKVMQIDTEVGGSEHSYATVH